MSLIYALNLVRIRKETHLEYCYHFHMRIPAYPDSETGNIRTAFRQHPDTLSMKTIL